MSFNISDFLEENESAQFLKDPTSSCMWTLTKKDMRGIPHISHFRCKKWRECENCYRLRMNDFSTHLARIEKKDAVSIVCEDDVAKKLLRKRKIVANDYFRSPLDSDMTIITISQELLNDVKFDDYMYKLDLRDESGEVNPSIVEAYTNIPTGKRTSGNLGKKAKEEKVLEYDEPINQDDTAIVESISHVVDASDATVAHWYIEAIKQTSPLSNVSPETLHWQRNDAFESLLKKEGISFFIVRRNNKKVSKKWLSNNFIIINSSDVKIKTNLDITDDRFELSDSFKYALSIEFNQKEVEFI